MLNQDNITNKSVEAMIDNIVTVVFRIHFYYITNEDLEQDLKQEGYLKAYELLAQGNYDPTKNLRTFIYTGVRNAMTNYMYHQNKENHFDLDTIDGQNWQSWKDVTTDDYWRGKVFYINDDILSNFNIDIEYILNICDKYKSFGDYFPTIINELSDLGVLNIKNKIDNTIKPIKLVKDTILGEIFWNMFKS